MKTKRISTSPQLLEKSDKLDKVKKTISKGKKSLKEKRKNDSKIGISVELKASKKGKRKRSRRNPVIVEDENIDDEVVKDDVEPKTEFKFNFNLETNEDDEVIEDDKMIVDDDALTFNRDGFYHNQKKSKKGKANGIVGDECDQAKSNVSRREISELARSYFEALNGKDKRKLVELVNLIYDQIKGRVVELASSWLCRLLNSLFCGESEDFKSKLFAELKVDHNKLLMNIESRSFLRTIIISGNLEQKMFAINCFKMANGRFPLLENTAAQKKSKKDQRRERQCKLLHLASLYWEVSRLNDKKIQVEVANLIYDQIKGRVIELTANPVYSRILKSLFCQEDKDFTSKLFNELKENIDKLPMNEDSVGLMRILAYKGSNTIEQTEFANGVLDRLNKAHFISKESIFPEKSAKPQEYYELIPNFSKYWELKKNKEIEEANKIADDMYEIIKGKVLNVRKTLVFS
ncbi:hypothetical protein CHUAL_001219 [Chamberlinius hualienensis]